MKVTAKNVDTKFNLNEILKTTDFVCVLHIVRRLERCCSDMDGYKLYLSERTRSE